MIKSPQQYKSAIETEIASYLPDATPQQRQRFAREVKLLQQIQELLRKYPENKQQCYQNLTNAEKNLDYKRARKNHD